MPAATIALERCDSYDPPAVQSTIETLLEPFGGMAAFVKAGSRVLLKPNFVVARPASAAANTHPVVIAACAKLVRQCGGTPFVGDSPGFGNAETVARRSGLAALADAVDLPIVTLDHGRRTRTQGGPVQSLWIAEEVLSADTVINLPKFKGHGQMLMTLAVKNVFGCIAGRRKALLHFQSRDSREWFARMLVQNYLLVRPALSIMDGITAMEGRGPANGPPKHLGVLMAGTDCVAMDRVAVELVGLPWRQLTTLAAAEDMGAGVTDLEQIRVVGRSIEDMRIEHFAFPALSPISFSPYRVAKGWVRNLVLHMRDRARAS